MKPLLIGVMAINLVWHGLATYHFLFFPARTLARYTSVRPVSEIAAQVFKFLGALNFALVGFAALCLYFSTTWTAFAFFGMANLSQFTIDVVVHRAGYTKSPFLRDIAIGDAVVTVLNTIVVFASA